MKKIVFNIASNTIILVFLRLIDLKRLARSKKHRAENSYRKKLLPLVCYFSAYL